MIRRIELIYEAYVRSFFREKPNIKRFFLKHERRHKFFRNMAEQVLEIERRKAIIFGKEELKMLVEDASRFFFEAALLHEEQQCLSRLEKERQAREVEQKLKAKNGDDTLEDPDYGSIKINARSTQSVLPTE